MRRLLFVAVLLMVLFASRTPAPSHPSPIHAQEGGVLATCNTLIDDALALIANTCIDIGRNEICYGNPTIRATLSDPDLFFEQPGDIIPVTAIEALFTNPLDPDLNEWGIALMDIQADLPDADDSVRVLVFGGAELTPTNPTPIDDMPTCTFRRADANLNLRAGPAKSYAIYDVLERGESVTVYGQTGDGAWLRSARGWIFANDGGVLSCEPDVELTEMNTPEDAYIAPMQSVELRMSDVAACGGVPRGILIQSPKGQTSTLMINNIEMRVGSTAFVTLDAEQQCQTHINLDGHVDMLGALWKPLPTGAQITLPLSDDDDTNCLNAYQVVPIEPAMVEYLSTFTSAGLPDVIPAPEPYEPVSPTVELSAADDEILHGTCTTLTWLVTDAAEVDLDGVAVGYSGQRTVCPSTETTYTLTAAPISEEVEGASASVTVDVFPPPSPSDPLPIPLVAAATCNGPDLQVTIQAGDAPFNISGTGNGLPNTAVGAGVYSFAGPATWTGVAVSETRHDFQSQLLGDFTCSAPPPPFTALQAEVMDVEGYIGISITAGDAPFNITGTGPSLPMMGVGIGTHYLGSYSVWQNVTVTEVGGDHQSVNLGIIDTEFVYAFIDCTQAGNLEIDILGGTAPFDITGTGPGLPLNGVGVGLHTLSGGVVRHWENVTIIEHSPGQEIANYGDFDCSQALLVEADCNGPNLEITIYNGDPPFNLTGSGTDLPQMGVGTGLHILTGPSSWQNVTITEVNGNQEVENLGNFTCIASTPLDVTAEFSGSDLLINIISGDNPFDITGTGPGLPQFGVPPNPVVLPGPGVWFNVTVSETSGNFESINLGSFDSEMVSGWAACLDGGGLQVVITGGNGPFDVVGTGPYLPLLGVDTGIHVLNGGTLRQWQGLTIIEQGGLHDLVLGDFDCSLVLTATIGCDGSDLLVDISYGDDPFDITGSGPSLPLSGVTHGAFYLFGPGIWSNVTITEMTGNLQSINYGGFTCP